MQILGKILFILLALAGIVSVFFVSWFWRLLLIPMIVILVVDIAGSFVKKKRKN